MAKGADALLKSPHLAAKGGRDHLLVTNTFRVRTFGKEFKRLLANATVAWFEQPIQPGGVRQNRVLYNLAFWRCTVVIPYLANPFCAIQPEGRFSSDAEAWKTLRTSVAPSRRHKRPRVPGSIFFQGSWAAAQMVRKHFSELQSMPGAHVHDVPRGCNLPENATKAVCIAARVRGTRLQTARECSRTSFAWCRGVTLLRPGGSLARSRAAACRLLLPTSIMSITRSPRKGTMTSGRSL